MAFFKIRVAQYFAFGVVIVSALIMGYIVYELSNTKHDFATQLIIQSSGKLESDLDEFFLPVENLMMTIKQHQKIRPFKSFDRVSLNNYFIPIINQYPQVSSVAMADSRGYEFNIIPDSTSRTWLNREVHVDQWGMMEKWDSWSYKGDSLSLIQSWESELENDPRTRPWFIGAINSPKETHWTEPYLYMTGDLGLTASAEWKFSTVDTLHQILAIDVTLKDLTNYSQKLKLTENNQNFILSSPDKNIVGLPQGYSDLSLEELSEKLMTSPVEFGNPVLVELLQHPMNQIVSFNSRDERWWGIVKPYSINSSQELLLAVIIPESDFSSKINSTRNAVIVGFIIILIISQLLVRNHNKLRSMSQELNENNKTIEEQKQLLFSEVHHRVKNNLAIIAAMIDLEIMESENKDVNHVLSKTGKRIRSMSSVHEILYKSDDMNRIHLNDFIPEILELHSDGQSLKSQIKGGFMNVNQALSYALLLNEFMNAIFGIDHIQKDEVTVHVEKQKDKLFTGIEISDTTDSFQKEKVIEKKLIDALLGQLDAEFTKIEKVDIVHYQISFKLEDKKGSTSNQSY